MNKKASIQDIGMIAAALLFFSLLILIGFKVVTEFNTNFASSALIPTEAKNTTTQIMNFYPGVIDNTFMFIAIGLAIGALVLAALVRVHPIFIPIFWIALMFIIFISGAFSNIYQATASNSELSSLSSQMTFMTQIMTYLPFIVGVVGHLLMIVMYKSWQASQE